MVQRTQFPAHRSPHRRLFTATIVERFLLWANATDATPLVVVGTALALVATYYSYLAGPINLSATIGNYDSDTCRAKVSRKMLAHKTVGDLPPPFPNGWYMLCDSAALPVSPPPPLLLPLCPSSALLTVHPPPGW